jgi:hypothetical protein
MRPISNDEREELTRRRLSITTRIEAFTFLELEDHPPRLESFSNGSVEPVHPPVM